MIILRTIIIVALVLGLFALDFYGILCANKAYDIMVGHDTVGLILGTCSLFIGANFSVVVLVGAILSLIDFVYNWQKGGDQ